MRDVEFVEVAPDFRANVLAGEPAPALAAASARDNGIWHLHPADRRVVPVAAIRLGRLPLAIWRLHRARPILVLANLLEEPAGRQVVRHEHEGLGDRVARVDDLAHLLALGLGVVAPKRDLALLRAAHFPHAAVAPLRPGVFRRHHFVGREVDAARYATALLAGQHVIGRRKHVVEHAELLTVDRRAARGLLPAGHITHKPVDRQIPKHAATLHFVTHDAAAARRHPARDPAGERAVLDLVLLIDAVKVGAAIALEALGGDQAKRDGLGSEIVDRLADRHGHQRHVAIVDALASQDRLQDGRLFRPNVAVGENLQDAIGLLQHGALVERALAVHVDIIGVEPIAVDQAAPEVLQNAVEPREAGSRVNLCPEKVGANRAAQRPACDCSDRAGDEGADASADDAAQGTARQTGRPELVHQPLAGHPAALLVDAAQDVERNADRPVDRLAACDEALHGFLRLCGALRRAAELEQLQLAALRRAVIEQAKPLDALLRLGGLHLALAAALGELLVADLLRAGNDKLLALAVLGVDHFGLSTAKGEALLDADAAVVVNDVVVGALAGSTRAAIEILVAGDACGAERL